MTAMRTLLNGMATNAYKLLSASTESSAMANALPRTQANFDFNGSTWANDAAVGGAPMAGVGAANDTPDMWAFGTAGISDVDGFCFFGGGGGHTNGGDSSFYTFLPETAAQSVNAGGGGIAWSLAYPSCMYIDAFTNLRPSSGTSPVGAIQHAPTTPSGVNTAYWTMPNKNGVAMPCAAHVYHTLKFDPGTKDVLISGFFGFDATAATSTGGGFVYNGTSNIVTGPLVTGSSIPSDGATKALGYDQLINTTPAGGVAINDIDHSCYVLRSYTYGWKLSKWTSPKTSSLALVDTGAFNQSQNPNSTADYIIIPDPAGTSTDRVLFQHGIGASDSKFLLITGLGTGGTPTWTSSSGSNGFQTYSGSVPTTAGSLFRHYAYDSSRGVIWMTDGANLYKITPNANAALWTISAAISASTGDVPPAATSGNAVSLQYVAAQDCLIHVYLAGVRVYKPTGWNPPADIVPAQPYNPWPQLAPLMAT